MRILVTGGMGEIGLPTVKHLLAKGHEVRVLDLQIDELIPGADCRAGDIMDLDGLYYHMKDIDSVVHLAAYRHPSMATEVAMLQVNGFGTFQVYRAAIDMGVKRLVCASSINSLGYNYGIHFPKGQLQYLPIDEQHPTYTTDPYSFSKQMIEEIGAYFWRREGVSSVFLRFPAVYDMDETKSPILKTFVFECRKQTAEIMALPEPERSQRVAGVIETFEQKAAAREWETKFDLSFPDAYIMFGRSNFWTSLDVRDAADAIERALTCDIKGSHAIYVTDKNNFVNLPSKQLAEVFFPEVRMWRKEISGTESLVSITQAKTLIGFESAFQF